MQDNEVLYLEQIDRLIDLYDHTNSTYITIIIAVISVAILGQFLINGYQINHIRKKMKNDIKNEISFSMDINNFNKASDYLTSLHFSFEVSRLHASKNSNNLEKDSPYAFYISLLNKFMLDLLDFISTYEKTIPNKEFTSAIQKINKDLMRIITVLRDEIIETRDNKERYPKATKELIILENLIKRLENKKIFRKYELIDLNETLKNSIE